MNVQDLENFVHNEDEVDIEDGDFGIIITPDGKLKMLLMPDDLDGPDEVPDILAKIVSLFESNNLGSVRTLH